MWSSCNTDESYVNTHHAPSTTWYQPGLPEKNDVVRPSGKGKRLVLVHAFTKDGWLSDDDAVHDSCVDVVIPSCELIYEAKKDDGDYHDNMNGSIYIRWMSNRLVPAFNKRYRGKKMVLVLDNASYHHHRGAGWIHVHRMSKAQLAAKLVELSVSSVEVLRQRKGTSAVETLRFDAATFSQRGGAYAPTLAELKAELTGWLDAHPEHKQTRSTSCAPSTATSWCTLLRISPLSSPSSACGRTSRTTWPLATRRDGACVSF